MEETKVKEKGQFLTSLKEFFKKDLVRYIVKRLLMFVPTLFLISVLAFFVIQLPEIDYVDREIAKLCAFGYTNKEIAVLLNTSESTISHAITRILNKTGLLNKKEFAFIL